MTALDSGAPVAHDQRRHRITRTVITGFAAKAAMFLPTLAIAKVVVPRLGAERFGVLMTVLSLLAFVSLADLGMGSSLVTSISRATGAGDQARVRALQANGLVAVAVMSLLLLLIALCLFRSHIGIFMFPRSAPAVQAEATLGVATFGVMFAVSLPLTLIGKIQLGLQRGDLANYWQIASAVVNFSAGSLAAAYGLGIPWILGGLMSGTLVCGAANFWLHYRQHPLERPSRERVSRVQIRRLLLDSSFYLALQLIFVIAYSSDTLIVARIFGAQQASAYALSERLFSMVAVAVSVITAPLWAAYGEAIGARDGQWVQNVLRLSTVRISVAAIGLVAVIVVALAPLVRFLSSGRIAVPLSLALSMGLWRIIEAVGSSLSVYMYARQAVRFLLLVGASTAVVSLVAKIEILPYAGTFAMPLIMAACYVLLCLLPTLHYIRTAGGLSAVQG